VTPRRLLGAVLAGGEGRRFGAPKADATVGGVSLVRRAVQALAEVVDTVVVVSSRPVADAPVEVIEDAVPGAGPLAGLASALDAAASRGLDGVLLLACDLPLVDGATLAAVRDALGERAAVAPRRGGAGVEPLCAAWSVAARDAASARLAGDDRSLHALFRDVEGAVLDRGTLGEGEVFLNVNTPGDRDRAEAALEARDARRNG
jgi:molybdopterin-guanine dinucleotide biosynthesis protein A